MRITRTSPLFYTFIILSHTHAHSSKRTRASSPALILQSQHLSRHCAARRAKRGEPLVWHVHILDGVCECGCKMRGKRDKRARHLSECKALVNRRTCKHIYANTRTRTPDASERGHIWISILSDRSKIYAQYVASSVMHEMSCTIFTSWNGTMLRADTGENHFLINSTELSFESIFCAATAHYSLFFHTRTLSKND